MDVRLSPEQRALRDAVAQVVDRHGPKSVADLADDARRAKLEAAVAGAGWRELRGADDSQSNGTPWASAVEAAIVAEELGRGRADVAFTGPTLAAELRRLAGWPEQASGETVVMSPTLERLGRDREAGVAIDVAGATQALLVDATGGLGVVPIGAATEAVDLTRPHAAIEAAASAPLDGASLSDEAVDSWTAFGLAVSCADLVGVMRGTIALATDYAKVRQQYGTLIGSFQAVQHLLADALVAMEGSRSVALHAAWAVDALPIGEAMVAAATAKAYCARAAQQVCEASIQVHGGIGNTWECLAHVYLRRALVSIDLFGGVGASLEHVLRHHEIEVAHGLR